MAFPGRQPLFSWLHPKEHEVTIAHGSTFAPHLLSLP